MTGYEVKIGETNMELSAKERIKYKDTGLAIRLDEATQQGKVLITPKGYIVLEVHNEKADDKDYTQYLIVDKDDQTYVTGSESFWSSFMNIAEEMEGEAEEWGIVAYRLPSKNRQGKDFITCTIA